MKHLVLTAFIILSSVTLSGQELDTLYFDAHDQLASSVKYDYMRTTRKVSQNEYVVSDYYANGSPKSQCRCVSKGKYQATAADFVHLKASKKIRLHGEYVSYYRSGGKNHQATYKKGKLLDNALNFMENGDTLYFIVDNMPEYPGGANKLREFIAREVMYPEDARQQRVQGMVYISFVVTKEGDVQLVTVARGVDPRLDQEALRVVASLGKWKPGTNAGKPANVAYTVPINFVLQ